MPIPTSRPELARLRSLGAIITKRRTRKPGRCVLSETSKDPIGAHLTQSLAALERATQDAGLLAAARKIASVSIAALRSGNKLLFIGNGGSAADAQHIAAEIVGRYKQDRPPRRQAPSPSCPRRRRTGDR